MLNTVAVSGSNPHYAAVTCYIEHWLWVVQILTILQSLVILNTVAVSGSNPHHAVVTCYVEHCGCEWFKSSLCCSPLLYWTLAVSGSDPHYAASLVILNIVAVSGSNPDYSAVACYIEYCGCEWFTVRLCCSHLLYGRGWFRPRLAAVTCYIKHCGYEWFRSWSCCVTCYIEHWLWVVQILIMLQSLAMLNTVHPGLGLSLVCERGGGRPGLPFPSSPYGLCGCKAD